MTKQTSEKERDMNLEEGTEQTGANGSQQQGADNMAEDMAQGGDNVSVEPSLEEQLAAWRDKYLRLQAEFDNFRKRTIKEKMDLAGKQPSTRTGLLQFPY